MTMYKWAMHEGQRLYDVGILADGSLHNPNDYPAETLRAAVLAADAQWRERRSQSAKKAAVTRRIRQDRRVYDVAQKIIEGHDIGPRPACAICGRGLDDPQSIERGIGSECWQGVLAAVSKACAKLLV